MRQLFGFVLLLGCINTFAQTPKFSVSVSTDTVLLGNYFELKFTIENTTSEGFEPPNLYDFKVIGGPNTASSMSIVNGEVSQSSTYSYYLEPPDIGVYTVKPAYLTHEEVALETPPIDIIVVPNPDGIIQRPNSPGTRIDQFMVPAKPKEEKPAYPRRKF